MNSIYTRIVGFESCADVCCGHPSAHAMLQSPDLEDIEPGLADQAKSSPVRIAGAR